MTADASPGARHFFRSRHRLSQAREFRAVYEARVKKARGPFVVFGVPNARRECRLGLSVGRRVGPAVARNRAKRLIRDAFRTLQHQLPTSPSGRYDLIVSLREPGTFTLEECRLALRELAEGVHREWERRARRAARDDAPPSGAEPAP